MSVTVELSTKVIVSARVLSTDTIGNIAALPINTEGNSRLSYGGTDGQSNQVSTVLTKLHSSRRTLTVSSSILDIDITQLTDIYGNSFATISKVHGIYIQNRDATGGMGLKIGAAASNPFKAPFVASGTAQVQVDALGEWFQTSPFKGWNVTATSKVLRLTNDAASTGPASFDFIIWGV